MKATVYCLEDHKMEIREAVSVSFPDAEVKFAAYEDLTVGGELLAVDHELVHLLKRMKQQVTRLYMYISKNACLLYPGRICWKKKERHM